MGKKELTHLYHRVVRGTTIGIGALHSEASEAIELFEKSLALTSDLKRLPFLLGGKLSILFAEHLPTSLIASGLIGVQITGYLMNGTYIDDDFQTPQDLILDERARDDILLMVAGHVGNVAGQAGVFDIKDSHWDFEGETVLYDTISLLLFLRTDVNVASAVLTGADMSVIMEVEIDWKPISAKDFQEFIMEHIYAKQGD